jgi:aryl-alcohol dehydrogenase-like predicted oxidoreductase
MIASKCGLVWDEAKNVTVNLAPKSLFQEIDQSLKRLDTDYIDIYQMHWPDPDTLIDESMDALMEIKKSGKIRYIGVSNFSLELTKAAASAGEIVSHQGLYNMLERNPKSYHNIPLTYQVEKEILPYCHEKGMAFWPYSPLFQGLLTGKFKSSGNFDNQDVRSENPKLSGETFQVYFEMVEKLKTLASEYGKPLTQVAINWLIEQPAVTSVICGAQNVDHIEENVASVEWDLTSDMMSQIEKILSPYQEYINT